MEAIIDVATDVGAHADDLFKAGVRTVIRYYNNRNTPANPAKCLTAREARDLQAAGLSICTVFEQRGGAGDAAHPKGHIEDLGAATGARDGARALALASGLGQPEGSGIYFAVDWDFAATAELKQITAYFAAVRDALGGGYRVGVYGSGLVARTLRARKLVDLVWLAGATGWSGTRLAREGGDYHLLQGGQKKSPVGGFFYDSNKAARTDFGQWRLPDLLIVTAPSGLRLRAGPGLDREVKRVIPDGTPVRGLGRSGDWMRVQLEGENGPAGYMHAAFLSSRAAPPQSPQSSASSA